MTFDEGGSFEGGRVRTRRGGKIAAGGGIGALVVAVLAIFLNQSGNGDLANVLQGVAGGGQEQGEIGTVGDCTAEQANEQRDCRLSATLQALDAYWAQEVPAAGAQFAEPPAEAFEGQTTTACGNATAATGPFYCPPDQTIYLDLGFYDVLQSQFGAQGGPLAEMYVTAHEYGHHVQNLTGVMDQAQRQGSGADSDSVRVELQADCYAGMWVGNAATQVDPDTGVTFLEPITAEELQQALSAAEAVGDDHIQQQSGGDVNPHTWTHGSSEQRQRWFTTGYEQGSMAACDTFATDAL